jgi:HSP20 family protein
MFELVPQRGMKALDQLRSEMDQLWQSFFENAGAPMLRMEPYAFSPTVNIKEMDEAFEITAEVPGLKPEEIEVSLSGDTLTIKGEKKEEKEEKKGDYRVWERRFGKFSRSFRLPVAVKKEKIEAVHKDGVLKMNLPKEKKEASTKIKIKS